MGTRSNICIVHNGKYYVMYQQWDGYYSGKGLDIVKLLKSHSITWFKEKVENLKVVEKDSEEWYNHYNTQKQLMGDKFRIGVINSVGELLKNEIWPQCDGYENMNIEPKRDTFIEYVYTINLDSDQLTVEGHESKATFQLDTLTVEFFESFAENNE